MALATLSIDIVAQLAKLQGGMDQAARIAEKNAAQIASAFGKVNAVIGALGGAAIGAGLATFAKQAIDGVMAIKDLAEATGASVETVSALEDVAKRAGGSMDEVTTTLIKFNQVLGDVDGKNEASRVLQAIGVDAEALKKLDPAEALRQTAVALAGFAEDGEKARAIQVLLGKSVKESAGFLRDLAEAGPLKPTITAEQVEAVDQYNKNLAQLSVNFDLAARTILGTFVPALNKVFEDINRSGGLWAKLLGGAELDQLGLRRKDLEGLTRQIASLTSEAETFARAMSKDAAAGLPENGAYRARYDEIRRQLFELQGQAQATRQAMTDAADALNPLAPRRDAGGGRGFINPPLVQPRIAVAPEAPKVSKAKAKALPGADLGGQFNFDPTDETKALLQLIDQTDAAKLEKAREQLRGLVDLLKEDPGNAALQEAIQILTLDIEELSPAAKQAAEDKARLDDILGQTPSAGVDKVLADIELLDKAMADGQITALQYKEALGVISGSKEELKGIDDNLRDLGMTFNSAFEDAVVNGAKFSDVLKGIEKDLIRLAIRQAITQPVANWASSVNWAELAGSLFGGQRAAGGSVQRGKFYRINELASHGPGEILNVGGEQYLMAASSGVVEPMSAGGSSGAGGVAQSGRAVRITYAPTINIDSRTDRAEVFAVVGRQLKQTKREIVEEINRGQA